MSGVKRVGHVSTKTGQHNTLMPLRSLKHLSNLHTVVTIPANPVISGNVWASSSYSQFRPDLSAVHRVEDMWLRVDVTVSSSASMLVDAPHFVDRIEFWANKGQELVMTQYGDVIFQRCIQLIPEAKIANGYLRDLNLTQNLKEGFWHPAGVSRGYRIPLSFNPLVINKEVLAKLSDTLEIRIFWRNVTNMPLAVGSGTCSVDNVFLEVSQETPTTNIEAKSFDDHARAVTGGVFLQPEVYNLQSQTLTASSQYEITLDQFIGKFAYFALWCQSTTDTTDSKNRRLTSSFEFPPTTTFDIIDASGNSIWGRGTAVRADLIYNQLLPGHFVNHRWHDLKKFFIIPFCNHIIEAEHGVIDGYLPLNKSKARLRINLPAAGTACVQSLDLANGSANAGYYRLNYKGQSTNALAHNTSAANIKAALEALPAFQEHPGGPLTVTASGVLSSDATLTFAANMQPPNEDLVVMATDSLNATGTGDGTSTSVTTYGNQGWTTGSYNLTLYAFKGREYKSSGTALVVRDI